MVVSESEAVADLVAMLERAGWTASRGGDRAVDVSRDPRGDAERTRHDLTLFLRVWRLYHPGVDATLLP